MSRNSNPYWYKLIKHLRTAGKIKAGVTIPFLFGAHKILGVPFDNVRSMILSVYNTEINKYPIIENCDVIEHYILKVEEKEVCHSFYRKYELKNPSFDNRLYLRNNAVLGTTIESAIKALTQIYESPISREEFSWNNSKKEWQKFSEEEIKLILEIK